MIKPSPDQITTWVTRNLGEHKVARRGRELRVNNPLSADDDYHLWINLPKALVNDFRPNYKEGVRGTFLSFVMKVKKIGFRDAVREVMGDVDYQDFEVPHYDQETSTPDIEIEYPLGFQKFTYDDTVMSSMVKTYLNKRCISNGKIYVLRMGHCGTNAVFPYYEFNKMVYWQQRSISSKQFLFPEDSSKAKFIYGIDSIDPTDPVIITESIFNALMFDNGIAIGGSDISDDQKMKLRKAGVKRIIVAFDNDGAGRAGTAKAFESLQAYFDLFYSLPDGEDDWNDIAQDYNNHEPMRVLKRNIKKLDFKRAVALRRSA